MLAEFVADSLLTGLIVVILGSVLTGFCVLLAAWPLMKVGVFSPKKYTSRGYATVQYFITYFSFLFCCILVFFIVLFCLGAIVEVFL
jgi:hypothetical protein